MAGDNLSLTPTAPLAQPLRGRRVLVVEDNEINQQVAQHILERAGAEVDIAAGGAVALAMLEREPRRFDAVLMDIRMPGMDGCEATRRIRARPELAALSIIAMTASTQDAEREQALQAGMDGWVAKPFDMASLVAALTAQRPQAGQAPSPGGRPPAAADLPGVDFQAAMVRLGGNYDLWISLLRQFEASQGGAVSEVRNFLAAGRVSEATGAVHRLKGIAANLGAVEVAGVAAELEMALKAGEVGGAADSLGRLQAAMSALLEAVRRLPQALPSTFPAVAPGGWRKDLVELVKYLRLNNLQAMAQFETLRPAIEAAEPDLARSLAAAVEMLDFAAAERFALKILEAEK